MLFKDKQHQEFYEENVNKTNSASDPYRKALFYTLGLTAETRNNINDLYDFNEKGILFDGLRKPWQTGSTGRVTRLAFNLYNNYHGNGEIGDNAGSYTPEDIFCDSLMIYFFEAVKLRYPEYFHEAGDSEK